MLPKINSAHGSDTRNILNRAIDLINAQGKAMQDLVAEGQLTPEEYAQLITIINSHLKSGEVNRKDLGPGLKNELDNYDARIKQIISGLDGTKEFYTPVDLDEYLTTQNEEWVI